MSEAKGHTAEEWAVIEKAFMAFCKKHKLRAALIASDGSAVMAGELTHAELLGALHIAKLFAEVAVVRVMDRQLAKQVPEEVKA